MTLDEIPKPFLAENADTRDSIVRPSLYSEMTSRLRDMIVEGKISAGERINEKALCERFGISRTPLREALKVLHSEGLVILLANRGARVAPLTAKTLFETFEIIGGLERHAAELAVPRMTEDDIKALSGLQNKIENTFRDNKTAEYVKQNESIHMLIVELSGNSLLVAAHRKFLVQVRRARFLGLTSHARWSEALVEHANILNAIKNRDGAKAGALLMQHVVKSGNAALANLAADERDGALRATAR